MAPSATFSPSGGTPSAQESFPSPPPGNDVRGYQKTFWSQPYPLLLQGDLTFQRALGSKGQHMSSEEVMKGLAHSDLGMVSASGRETWGVKKQLMGCASPPKASLTTLRISAGGGGLMDKCVSCPTTSSPFQTCLIWQLFEKRHPREQGSHLLERVPSQHQHLPYPHTGARNQIQADNYFPSL